MIEFKIAKDFHGPTLEEQVSVLDAIADPVEVRWTGSKADYRMLDTHLRRHFILVVPDVETHERALWRLGLGHCITPEDLLAAKQGLVRKDQQTWRAQCSPLGYDRGTLLLCRIMSSALLEGKPTPSPVVSLACDCVLNHMDPADTDVLLRLQALH